MRILNDSDFIVPDNEFEQAVRILSENNYHSDEPIDFKLREYIKHHPVLFNKDYPALVEVHRMPANYEYRHLLNAGEIFKERNLVKVHDAYIPDLKHLIRHNFIHAQLEEKGYYYGKTFLRGLYDLFLLSRNTSLEETLKQLPNHKRKAFSYLHVF